MASRPRSRATTRTRRRARREEAAAMTETTTLERLLLDDLDVEAERAADEKFCTELYRALTRSVWRNDRDPDGELSPSFQRAEWLVNEWRGGAGPEAPLVPPHRGGGGGEPAGAGDLSGGAGGPPPPPPPPRPPPPPPPPRR